MHTAMTRSIAGVDAENGQAVVIGRRRPMCDAQGSQIMWLARGLSDIAYLKNVVTRFQVVPPSIVKRLQCLTHIRLARSQE